MLPFCLPGSGHLSIEKISAPDSGLTRQATIDPKQTAKRISMKTYFSTLAHFSDLLK
jgi:hypothetical protein